MKQRSLPLRKGTYNATTVFHEFLALFNGLSLRIMQLSYRVKKLRACLHVRFFSLTPFQNITIVSIGHQRDGAEQKKRWILHPFR